MNVNDNFEAANDSGVANVQAGVKAGWAARGMVLVNDYVARVVYNYRERQRINRSIELMMHLNDNQLRDIGVARAEIPHVIEKAVHDQRAA